jgi:PAS domain S-box-containing protein
MNESIHGERTASEPQDRSSSVAHSIEVPSEIIRKWQEIVNLLAEIMHVPSASIMRVDPPHIKVLVSSTSKGNPCEPGALDTGPYCETVMKTGQPLLVPDARENEAWKANPHVRLGMISYLGVPIGWPDGGIFGTICVRDNKRNEYSEAYLKLLLHFRDMLQAELKSLARFHGEIEEREAKIRRLVDANIIGIFVWDVEGRILEANDAFLHLVGYDRGDLASARMRWTDLTPAEWRERDERARAELSSTGTVQPYEKEYFRKDGDRVPVLIGGALFEQSGSEGVAFVLDLTERNRAEGALRESEYKLRQIIETVPSLLWSTDPAGEPTQLSQRMLDYSGMQFEDFLHGGWEAFIHPDDFPETARAFYQAIQVGTSYQAVNRLRRADGEFRWHQTRGEPLRDREGQIVQWYGLSVDIDERKKAEERLRRSESYLAEAQRLSHTGTWFLDARTMRYLYWSDEAYRIWGFDPLQGHPSRENMWQRIHPDDRDRVWEEVQEALRQKRDVSSEFRILLPDGTIKYLEAANYHGFSSSGVLAEAVSAHIDVTERKRAEEALRESEAKIQRLVDSNIIGIFIWDFDGRVLEANDEFLRMVNYDREDLVSGRIRWADLTPPDWRDRNNARIEQQKSSGRLEPVEKEYMRKDGSRVSVLMGGATFDEGGNQGVAFVLDLTERKRAEEALRKSEAKLRTVQAELAHVSRVMTLGQLTASIAHEVKQPIATARNNANAALNFLDKQPPDLGEVREALGCIVGDADRAGDIIDRIRDHIKKAPPQDDRFDLNTAINEVIELAHSAINENGVSVQTRFTDELYPVRGDRVQVQQVVLNLVLNAIEAMGSVEAGARELLISTEQSQTNDVLVAVRDSGPGIDPECLERVFEAFYTTKSGGMGMGLSICRSIIEAHNGRLWASANVPRGATFEFTVSAHPDIAS